MKMCRFIATILCTATIITKASALMFHFPNNHLSSSSSSSSSNIVNINKSFPSSRRSFLTSNNNNKFSQSRPSSSSSSYWSQSKRTTTPISTPPRHLLYVSQMEDEEVDHIPSQEELRNKLIQFIPQMLGNEDDFRTVEFCVNSLEEHFTPFLTLDFFNLAIAGEWQLLFSTNLLRPANRTLRIRELIQRVEPNGLEGTITTMALWDYAEDGQTFSASGTFSIQSIYQINQGGSRMFIPDNNDNNNNNTIPNHQISLAKGSSLPSDFETLIAIIRRAIPNELFDPSGVFIDTTYADPDVRLIRYSSGTEGQSRMFEGVRNIFVRRGAVGIDPTASSSSFSAETQER